MGERLIPYALLAICIVSGAIAQVLFKLAMLHIQGDSLPELLIQMIKTRQLIIGIVLYGTSFILWLLALRSLDVSFMYPLLSLAYILVVFMSAVILKETIHLTRWIGVVLIVIGAILVGLNK